MCVTFSTRTICDIACIHEVVNDEEIKVSISVVVEKGRAAAPAWIANTRKACDIRERSVTVIAVEHIRADIGHINIYVPIVIVVGTSDSLPVVASVANPSSYRDVSKCAVPVVLIERTGCLFC